VENIASKARRIQENNIKMDLKERWCDFLVWIYPAPHTDGPVESCYEPGNEVYKAENPSLPDRALVSEK
jgi:hypothetical protein